MRSLSILRCFLSATAFCSFSCFCLFGHCVDWASETVRNVRAAGPPTEWAEPPRLRGLRAHKIDPVAGQRRTRCWQTSSHSYMIFYHHGGWSVYTSNVVYAVARETLPQSQCSSFLVCAPRGSILRPRSPVLFGLRLGASALLCPAIVPVVRGLRRNLLRRRSAPVPGRSNVPCKKGASQSQRVGSCGCRCARGRTHSNSIAAPPRCGTRVAKLPFPNAEALRYCRISLRDSSGRLTGK